MLLLSGNSFSRYDWKRAQAPLHQFPVFSQKKNANREQFVPISPMKMKNPTSPVVLCIAGFDPSGGAGLLADARACAAFGAFAVCAQTGIAAQNTRGVTAIFPTEIRALRAQLDALLDDFEIGAVKIGAIFSLETVEIVAQTIEKLKVPVVIDPVLAPSNGPDFGDETVWRALQTRLFPLATLLTPNAPEAAILSGQNVENLADAEKIAPLLGARNVLLKGGHLLADTDEATDLFWDGVQIFHLRAPRQIGTEVRGTGCLLSSAIAAQLAAGIEPLEAAKRAKIWLTIQIREAQMLGNGRRVAF